MVGRVGGVCIYMCVCVFRFVSIHPSSQAAYTYLLALSLVRSSSTSASKKCAGLSWHLNRHMWYTTYDAVEAVDALVDRGSNEAPL